MTTTTNSTQAMYHFALSYSYDKNVKFAVECASDYLDTVKDVNEFEKKLAIFLAGKSSITVERMNEDGTFRKEEAKYQK